MLATLLDNGGDTMPGIRQAMVKRMPSRDIYLLRDSLTDKGFITKAGPGVYTGQLYVITELGKSVLSIYEKAIGDPRQLNINRKRARARREARKLFDKDV